MLLPSPLGTGELPHPSAQAVPPRHLCLPLTGAFRPPVTRPAATVPLSLPRDISHSHAAPQQRMLHSGVAPLGRHQARFCCKYPQEISSALPALLAAAAASDFGSPGTPPFPRQAPAGSRGGLGSEPRLQTSLAPAGPGSCRCPSHQHHREQSPHRTGMCTGAPPAPLEERLWGQWQEPPASLEATVAPRLGLSQAAGRGTGSCRGSPHTSGTGQSPRLLLLGRLGQQRLPLAPGSGGWSLLSPPPARPEGHDIASKAGRRLPGKGSDPSPAAPAGSGMGELGQSQGRAPGWPPWPGAGREVVAAAAPSREGWLPVPAADATPQPPPASASPAAWPQPQTKHLGLGERSSSRRQDNPQTTGAGWARLEVKAKPATGTGWGDICLSKGNTPLLWEPSQANDFPISFTIKPVQVLCCKEPLCSAVPLQR